MSEYSVTYYKNVNVASTELTVPEKLKGRYFSYLSNNSLPLFVQTPTLYVQSVEDHSVKLHCKKDGQFAQLFNQLDTFLVDYITERSRDFFRGSIFSKTKIQSSYIPSVDDEGNIVVHVNDPDKILIRDQRDVTKTFADLQPNSESISILNIEGVAFTKKTIRLILTLHQMKLYTKEKLTDWCIFNDSDSECEEFDVEEAEREAKAIEMAYEQTKQMNRARSNKDSLEESKEEDSTIDVASAKKVITSNITTNDDDKDLF
jgi:hypothetical protein